MFLAPEPPILSPDISHLLNLVQLRRLTQTRASALRWCRHAKFGSNFSCGGFPACSQEVPRRAPEAPLKVARYPRIFPEGPEGPRWFERPTNQRIIRPTNQRTEQPPQVICSTSLATCFTIHIRHNTDYTPHHRHLKICI